MVRTILGVIPNSDLAERAVNRLTDLGYDPKEISIVMRDDNKKYELKDETGVNVAEGAVAGATTGGVIGGLTGLLVGIGAITIPGIGAILIGGPLAAALGLAGAAATTVSGAVTGLLAGGLVGALVGMGIPESDAKKYEDSIREGAILIAVPATRMGENEVRDVLENFGATQIRSVTHSEEIKGPEVRQREVYPDEGYYQTGIKGGEAKKEED